MQGVFFRRQAKGIADEIGLVGWVRNEPDGAVKIVAEGDEAGLKKMIEKCYTIPGRTRFVLPGIPSARTDKIEVEWQEATGEFNEFSIKYNV